MLRQQRQNAWLRDSVAQQELFTRQSPQRLKVLRDHALVESAVSSNRIEGVTIARARVRPVVIGKGRLRDRDEEEVRGYRNALRHRQEPAEDGSCRVPRARPIGRGEEDRASAERFPDVPVRFGVIDQKASTPAPWRVVQSLVVLTKEEIVAGLGRLAELLKEHHTEGEVCLFGGAVMVLAFQARPSTKDVDAIFQPAPLVRILARQVAVERDLPEDWLNDGVKGFVSARHETGTEDLPQFDGLRVTAPTPEYLLAMKCMASRIAAGPDDPGDVQDIRFLVKRLGLASASQALSIVARYYPEERIPPRTQYLLEDVFSSGTS